MVPPESQRNDTTHAVGGIFQHSFAIVVGLILMIVGLGMGVTILLLPIGLPVGLLGLAVFLWGLFGRRSNLPRQ